MARVVDRDLGYKRIFRDLQAYASMTLEFGVFKDAGKEDDGTDLVDVAIYNEYGTEDGHIPPRPFLRQATDKNTDKWYKRLDMYKDQIVRGAIRPKTALELLGIEAVNDIQEEIASGEFKPNAPATIRKKGSSRPLTHTGALRTRGIAYRVS